MRRFTPAALALCAALIATSTAEASTSICDPLSGTALTSAVAARGADGVREPDLGEVHADLPATAKGSAGKSFRATVPVYVHIVTAGTVGNVTDDQIAAQIAVLNTHLRGRRGRREHGLLVPPRRRDAHRQRRVVLRGARRHDEHAMKKALHQGGDDALNFYSTTAGDFLGWAYLPDITTKPGQAYLDGIVIDWESIPGTSTHLRGPVRPGRDRHARGRPLARPRAHVLRRAATPRATSSTTRRPSARRPRAARRARTPARRPARTRSTTTWTTPTTAATRSSRPASRSGCATPGCSIARSDAGYGVNVRRSPSAGERRRSTLSSARITCITALISARWVNACGKLPRWRPVRVSISSA